MERKIQLLDCTLRDGAYIVDSEFGTPAMRGIIKNLGEANIDVIECGWLKDKPHKPGTTFFHVPSDALQYIGEKKKNAIYVAMIDWDRYDLNNLPECDGKSIDAIRVVFPQNKFREGIEVGKAVKAKGYALYLQAANTLGYSDDELKALAEEINKAQPVCISVVDTFGAMYPEDLQRILSVLDKHIDGGIKIGFHSHNNQQLSFALCMDFIRIMSECGRHIVVDSSLCGMGRGAGNATTELVANYLNVNCGANYDMNIIMDTIDTYMQYFSENYHWGYSIPYFIAGMFCCHVNNIAYLLKNHRTNARDMRNIIESLSPADRKKYDYDLLEQKYILNQNRIVDDADAIKRLKAEFNGREILLIAPGETVAAKSDYILDYIAEHKPIVIGVNAIIAPYKYDYLFFTNTARYEYAGESYPDVFNATEKILLSDIKTKAADRELIINFERAIKRGWEHFDNAVICCLRLLSKLGVERVKLAGFDGFKTRYNESYADPKLPSLNPDGKWDELNEEIKDMYADVLRSAPEMSVKFITESIFDVGEKK